MFDKFTQRLNRPFLDDINAPRLMHGTQLVNLDSIFQNGLDPDICGINFCGSVRNAQEIDFNIIGVVPEFRITKTESGDFTKDKSLLPGKFGDGYFQGLECYLLIDESALLEKHQKILEEANIHSPSLNIDELRALTNENISAVFGGRERNSGWDACCNVDKGNFGLVDPERKWLGGGAMEAVSIDLIKQMKHLRALSEERRTERIQSRGACNFGGIFTTHKIPVNGILGIVLSPMEVVNEENKVSGFITTEDALAHIVHISEKHGVYIPIYAYDGTVLYNPDEA